VPYLDALPAVKSLYAALSAEEQKYPNKKQAIQASVRMLQGALRERDQSYGEFVFGLSKFTALEAAVA
jgi:hypothetical protein